MLWTLASIILFGLLPVAALLDYLCWGWVARQTRPSDKYYAEQLRLAWAQLELNRRAMLTPAERELENWALAEAEKRQKKRHKEELLAKAIAVGVILVLVVSLILVSRP